MISLSRISACHSSSSPAFISNSLTGDMGTVILSVTDALAGISLVLVIMPYITLLQMYREEKDPSVKDRLMLVIKVRFEDTSITKAAGALGNITSWGGKWFARFAEAGLDGLRNLPRSGRPALIAEQETERIWNEMDGKHWIVGRACELISRETGVRYSISSIYNMLKRREYFLWAPVKLHVRRPPDE